MVKDLLSRGKITRTARGQLPKNYISDGKTMQRHPGSISINFVSPDYHHNQKQHKNKSKRK